MPGQGRRPGDLGVLQARGRLGVVLGLDVGKTAHHGHGLTPTGKKVFDKPLPNSQPKLRAVFDKPAAKFDTVLVIVDQPVSIGALCLTVARDAGCKVAYLPGLAMRRIADLYPGEAKTDAKDVAVIADAARTLRSLELTDEITAELTVLTGFDQDLAAEATRTSNRIRGLLVVVPGTGTPRRRHPVPGPLAGVHEQCRALEAQINALLEAHPASPVLTSMPGVGVRTAAALLVTVGDGTGFPSAAHLASYAGLAPTTKSSGNSIHGEHAPRRGNRQLKRAMVLSAFACMNADPASRTYYDRQRARGKDHTQALLRLARQRISVLFAMLHDGTFYEPRLPQRTAA
ncbi:IS110 family transposase [Streptomyces anulatus]|uniref:IS110 family transposase n=1 Tax=Streptomyces anulatus TaxID=1892 RepID=UPI0036DCC90F